MNIKKLTIRTSKLNSNKEVYYTYNSLEEEYFRNADIRAITEYDSDGDINSKQIYTHTDEGLIKEIVNYEKGDLIERTEFVENELGNLKEVIVTYSDNSKHIKRFNYSLDNILLNTIEVNEDGSLYRKEVFEHDSFGREIKVEIYDENKELIHRSKFEYLKETGLLTKQIVEDFFVEEYSVTNTSYNMHNQIISEEIFTLDGVLTGRASYSYKGDISLGWIHNDIFNGTITKLEIEYDNLNNPIIEKKSSNDIVEHYVEREYNNEGLITREEEFKLGDYTTPNIFFIHEFIYEYFD